MKSRFLMWRAGPAFHRSANHAGTPPFSVFFAERVGAIFPIWNRARCPSRFFLDPRLHFR